MTAHRIHRAADLRRYPPKTEAVFPQDLDFHIHLVRDHRRLKKPPIFSVRCINFQSLACVNLQPLLTQQLDQVKDDALRVVGVGVEFGADR